VEIESDPRKRGAGKTVLVVDDNAAIRKMLASAFLSDGFKTCGEAENGKEAVELAKQIKPDVITLDLSMPVMNGITAASELRRIFPTTPIILFTLYGDSVSKAAASEAGVRPCSPKNRAFFRPHRRRTRTNGQLVLLCYKLDTFLHRKHSGAVLSRVLFCA
jgi:two-component system chemotaxis response regulator CheY